MIWAFWRPQNFARSPDVLDKNMKACTSRFSRSRFAPGLPLGGPDQTCQKLCTGCSKLVLTTNGEQRGCSFGECFGVFQALNA